MTQPVVTQADRDLLEALSQGEILVRSLMREIRISDHIVLPEGQKAVSARKWLALIASRKGEQS